MQWRNPIRQGDGRIDCEVEHPRHGWVRFTADPADVEAHGRDLHRAILETEAAGEVRVPDAPAPEPGRPDLTPGQFEWLLAYTGLDDLWDAVQARAKAGGDRARYASLKAQRAAGGIGYPWLRSFTQDPAVLAVAAGMPALDLSDEALGRAWDMAAAQPAKSSWSATPTAIGGEGSPARDRPVRAGKKDASG